MPSKRVGIKKARKFARLSVEEASKFFGFTQDTYEKYENGDIHLPEYQKNHMISDLMRYNLKAKIHLEHNWNGNRGMGGFSCWIIDPDNPAKGFQFYWFVPINKGDVNSEIVWKIQRLIDWGYKIEFYIEQ